MCPLLPWALHYCGLVGLASTQVREWKHDFLLGEGGTGGHVGQFGQGHWISSHHSFTSEMALCLNQPVVVGYDPENSHCYRPCSIFSGKIIEIQGYTPQKLT